MKKIEESLSNIAGGFEAIDKSLVVLEDMEKVGRELLTEEEYESFTKASELLNKLTCRLDTSLNYYCRHIRINQKINGQKDHA
jgi:hypothetical protein